MTSDTHEIEKAGFRFDRLGFPEFTLCPLDRVKVSRNPAQARAVCACRITRANSKNRCVYGPVRTVVEEGWSREASPYPDRNRGERRTGPWMPG